MENTFSTNVLILGKTGVGKSSLLNYLFGDEIAHVGSGKPVTGEGIFTYKPFDYNGINITINDSWGIEADKAGKWKAIIESKVEENNSKEIKDWFHTIIYCVDAKRSRLEEYEINEILNPLVNDGNYIIICFTKSDLASEKEKEENKKVIQEYCKNIDFVEISSVATKLRGGRTTTKFGREKMLKKVVENLKKNLIYKLSHNLYRDTIKALEDEYTNALSYYEEKSGPLGFFTIYGEDFQNSLREKAKDLYFGHQSELIIKFNKDLVRINELTNEISNKFLYDIDKSDLITHFELTPFNDWNNDASDYARSILASIFRVTKRRYTEYREKYIQFLNQINGKILDDIKAYLNKLLENENIQFKF